KITNTLIRPVGSTLQLGAGASVGNDVQGDPDLPVWPSPAPLNCPTGGSDESGANNETRTLTPGNYGDYSLNSNFTLECNGAGDYYVGSITAASNAVFKVVPPGVRVGVCDKVSLGANAGVDGVTQPSDLYVEVHGAGLNAFVATGGVD